MSRSTRPASSTLASASRETVTFVSDVDTRSIESPQRPNTWNALARKPTSCHIPTVSMETSTMLFLQEIALSCAGPSAAPRRMTVPSTCGIAVLNTRIGMPRSRTAGMHRGWSTLLPVVAISWASR